MRRAAVATLTVLALGSSVPANGQDFYQGKTIRMIAGTQVGASYDTYARLLARHMPRHIPGNPKIVVQNLPTAEGMVAINNLYNVAARDGTTMGMLNRASVLVGIVGNQQARFKAEKFNWLGTAASFDDNAYLFVIRSALPHKTISDLRAPGPPVHVGNSGSPMISLLKRAFNLNVKIIEGYGKSELDLAFERGELDGEGIAYANLVARRSDWLEKKFIRVMIQFGRTQRFSAYPDVPTAREVAATPEDRDLVELAEASLRIAYPFALPPDVPADRIALIKHAFMATMNDPAYRADVLKGKLEYSPLNGDEVQNIIARIAQMSPGTIARYREIISSSKAGG